MVNKEAMKLALEALEVATTPLARDRQEVLRAIAALREALAEQPAQQCRTDGRCQYAIDSGAEGMGHCPKGKCVMPAQQEPEKDWDAVGQAHLAALKKSSKKLVEEAAVRTVHKMAQQQEPVARQYQGRDGVWKDFISEKHYKATLEDGSWPIRNLYTSPQSKPLTDEMVVAAARVLSDRQAAACNVDCGDMWKLHGNDFIDDARAALEAAHGIREKNT